jgi:hypothetical protein
MKRKFMFALIMALVAAVSLSVGVYAATDIKLFVNGKLSPVEVQIIDGSSYVPLRAVAEMLGADVKWDGDARTITITSKDAKKEVATTPPKSFTVNVNMQSGPIKMNISKVTLDPAYSKGEYYSKVAAVVLDVTVENTSTDKVSWHPAQGTIVLNTKEQIDGDLFNSDDVGGEFLGKVIKKGKIVFPVKSSKFEDITSFNFTVDGAFNSDSYSRIGNDQTVEVILK